MNALDDPCPECGNAIVADLSFARTCITCKNPAAFDGAKYLKARKAQLELERTQNARILDLSRLRK